MKIGLYIHLPYCRSKCPYCDFNSYPLKEKDDLKHYLKALYEEINIYADQLKNVVLKSIYFGGGTPTLLSGVSIFNLLDTCIRRFKTEKFMEVTIEANPGTIDRKKLKILHEAGVNRLSLGGQSLNNHLLKKIGRIHSAEDVIDITFNARASGFKNINMDIMYALPGQTLEELQVTLRKTIDLKPEHISLYGLTLSPGTQFYIDNQNNLLDLPSEDTEFNMFEWSIDYLKKQGYEHYEISNFALEGKRSVHNQIYWKNQQYLGVGAGAFSYIRGYRYSNTKNPTDYIKRLSCGDLPREAGEKLSLKKKMAETVILWLRTRDGVNISNFYQRFKIDVHQPFGTQINKLKDMRLLEGNKSFFRLSKKGIFLANQVFEAFII